ncbi:MAG: hypothetical protein CM15mP32_4540 [Flavobacteriaceae bacterium]|nr:MAG: hypothetical protein CM15mP32_4540 [Flavobacteriaceae bacterium]
MQKLKQNPFFFLFLFTFFCFESKRPNVHFKNINLKEGFKIIISDTSRTIRLYGVCIEKGFDRFDGIKRQF